MIKIKNNFEKYGFMNEKTIVALNQNFIDSYIEINKILNI